MERNEYIAIFDSGIGGFTALLEAVKMLPQENFFFYADTKHVPYGDRSVENVRELTMKAVEKMLHYKLKAVILACNTATSAGAGQLRSKYSIPIIGMEPAVKLALQSTQANIKAKRVLLLSTNLTMKGEKLKRLLANEDKEQLVDCLALPELVAMAELAEFSGQQVEEFFAGLLAEYQLEDYGAIVLGCTHFVWYKELLQKILPQHIQVIDGNLGTIQHLKRLLEENNKAAQANPNREILLHFTKQPDLSVLRKLTEKIACPVKLV